MVKQQLKEKLKSLKPLLYKIEELLRGNQLDEAGELIQEYMQYIQDAEIVSLHAMQRFQQGLNNEAINILRDGIIKHPYQFELNLNLGIVLEYSHSILESLDCYAYAIRFAGTEEESQLATQHLENAISRLSEYTSLTSVQLQEAEASFTKILQEIDGRGFPISYDGTTSMIRQVINKGTEHEYLVNMYKSFRIRNVEPDSRLYFKTELFKGKESNGVIDVHLKEKSIVPVSLINPSTQLSFTINNKEYPFIDKPLEDNRYHYFRFDEPGLLKVHSEDRVFVGHPIPLKDELNSPKLVLKIFIDGLSHKFLQENGLEQSMPHTYSFFKEGFIADNCYATSEWTLPCKASINTGIYPTRHRLLHPKLAYHFEKDNKLLAEYMKEAGYFTANICTNWRTTPTFGYYKGFDRIIYQNFTGGMECGEVITETIEHLETFKHKNNYLAISLMDLHNVPDEIENNIYAQANIPIASRVYTNNTGETSVLTKYDTQKIKKYLIEIKRLDTFLSILYQYINANYTNDEIIVVLHSDHGQTFLEANDYIAHESRRKVPLMVKGHGIPKVQSKELIEIVDILPIILNTCGVEVPSYIDGQLPCEFGGDNERSYALTHIIHPQQPYTATIVDLEHTFTFQTTGDVNNDITIYLEEYNYKLVDNATGNDVTYLFEDKAIEYTEIVLSHSKNMLKWKRD